MDRPRAMPVRILGVAVAMLLASPTRAQSEAELAQVAKSLGVITSPDAKGFGNATVLDACHVLTNFHVAFGTTKDPLTGQVQTVDNPAVGHVVEFSYKLDAQTGQMANKMRATVIEFDDYAPGVGRGMVADKALLRLEGCLEKDYINVVLDRPAAEQRVPAGNLVALGLIKESGKFKILTIGSCPSFPATIVTGLFLANCRMPPGTSGSMILSKERSDGKLRMVGLTTDGRLFDDGSFATYAIYSKDIAKFVDGGIRECKCTR